MSRTYKTEGVILKRKNYGETDKIITIFTKHYGKINCLAKGIRNITSRKGGNLELFNLTTIFLAKGKNLDIVTEAQVINTFKDFRQDLHKVALAFQAAELVDRFLLDSQTNETVFLNLRNFLQDLNKNNLELKNLILNFKINLLENTGFGLPKIINEQEIDIHITKIIEKRVKCFYE